MFSICSVNAMENEAVSTSLSNLAEEGIFSFLWSLKPDFRLTNYLYTPLIIGGIIWYLKYQDSQKLEKAGHELEREREENRPIESTLNSIRTVKNIEDIPKETDMKSKLKLGFITNYTLLCAVALKCNSEKLRYVIENCTNGEEAINFQIKGNTYRSAITGDTALHIAVRFNQYHNFIVLLEYEANHTIKNSENKICTEIDPLIKNGTSWNKAPTEDKRYVIALNYYKIWRIKDKIEQNKKLKEFVGNKDNQDSCREIANKFGHPDTLDLLEKLEN